MRLEVMQEPFCGSFYFGTCLLKDALFGLRQFLTTESLSKMMKNAFYFILKALLFPGYLHFCPGFLGMKKDGFTKKLRLTSNL